MNQQVPPYFNRKEIASMAHLSVKSVARNEKQLGIEPARENINARHVRYKSLIVLAALEQRGLISK